MDKNIVIKAENISKQYRLGQVGTGTISHDLNRFWHKIRGKEDPYLKIGETNDRATKGDSDYVWSLRDINFEIEQGDAVGIIGRNGAGKTTLFNCLNRDLKADSGNFYIEDENGVRREVSAEDIGYVLSTPTVPEFLTGREFLKFFMDINEKSIKNPKSIDEYFDYMSIEPEDRDKLLKDYSHGMKNKMQMLINIIAQPNILLLDEPLTSLDVVVAEEMKQLLRSLKQDRITIFSTHIMDLALDLCDEIVLLNHGELEVVEKTDLDSREFKDKIIAALREEGNE